jgi:protein gp37
MDAAWAVDIRDQCRRARVPFFFKQWGGTNKKRAGRALDGRVWDEMPARVATRDSSVAAT